MDVEMKDSGNVAEVREKLKSIIDVSSPDFQAQVRQLADAIGLRGVNHPDPVTLLQAICIFVGQALDEQRLQEDTSEQHKIGFKEVPLGLKSSGNLDVDNAAKILRLMNVEQLRRLQTQINILTVAVQKVTADPKTDSNLGKVGR